ncbi:cytochrome c oxidase cbb3-type subunit 3 [Rhizobium sp. BK512]|nr:cytochrome c oxidase cbb3-type subunit 3 [Rhizobium sp. BK512]
MPMVARRWLLVTICLLGAACAGAMLGWMRQPRQYRAPPPVSASLNDVRLMADGIGGTPPEVYFAIGTPYENTAYDLSQGKRLYTWFGCPACHGDGRGLSGPSFLDGWWSYGPEMETLVASIHDGRPHGMPAFADRMTIDEIWQLAGYLRTVGAYQAKYTAPARNDEKNSRPAENRAPAAGLFQEGPVGMRRLDRQQ